MNSDQQPFGQPLQSNPFIEMDSQQIARIMQQNSKDPEDANNSQNSYLEDFLTVASDIIAVEKVEPNRNLEIAKARTIINDHWPVLLSESIELEDLSEDARIILAKLENKAGYCLSDEQKKEALGLIRCLQLSCFATVERVIDLMSEKPLLKDFAQLLKACSDQ